MKKTFFVKSPLSLFIILLLFFASCNTNDSAPVKTDAENTIEKKDLSIVDSNVLNGYLNILSIEAPNFPTNGNRLTFRFYDTLNSLTLHGWLGVNFNDKPPAIRLKLASKSSVQLATGNYLGNLILKEPQVREINRLKGSYKFILFIPKIDTSGNDRGSIVYTISFTDTDPVTFTNITPKDLTTDIITNPSPPRNSGNL